MKKKEIIIAFLLFLFITAVFFYKFFLHGLVPFPGDLLIAEYSPWKSYSYLGYNPGSFPNKAQYFDVLRQIYPWKTLSLGLLKIGEIPLWNPYSFSGTPLLANFQSAIFYPFNILYLFLPQIKAWSTLVFLQPLLASFFTYLFARKIGISKLGSLLSGLSYGFSSFMTVWLEYNTIGHVIAWFPLLLYGVEKIFEKIKISSILLFVVPIVMSIFAGHPQVAFYSFIFAFFYIFYKVLVSKNNVKKYGIKLLFIILLFLLSVGITAIQILPGIELIRESARVPHDYNFFINKVLFQPWQFIMLIVPDFFGNPATRNYFLDDTYIGKVTYIGIIPLFFVFFCFKYIRKKIVQFFILSGLIVILLVSVNPLTYFIYKFNFPIVSTSAPTLSVFLFCFSLSILSGFGVDFFRRGQESLKRVLIILSPLILVLLCLGIIIFFVPNLISDNLAENSETAFRNLILSSLILIIGLVSILVGTVKKKLIYIVLVLLIAIQVIDLFRYFGKFNPFVPEDLVFPSAKVLAFLDKKTDFDRIWGYRSANIEANFATQYKLFSTDGYDPLYVRRYGEFIQASEKGKITKDFTRRTRSDAFISMERDLIENPYRLKILDLLGALVDTIGKLNLYIK